MKHNTAELTGDLLDAAVALALGHRVQVSPADPGYEVLDKHFGHLVEDADWSVSWASAGPIIERHDWALPMINNRPYVQHMGRYVAETPGGFSYFGPTPLIAAMRAFVASKLGDEVELP